MPRAAAVLALLVFGLSAGEFPRASMRIAAVLRSWTGLSHEESTPMLPASPEYPAGSPVHSHYRSEDLSVIGYVKHDGKYLYFAFDVTDDVLYGIDTPRWLPDNNPQAHEISRAGFPWFGDEMEILINATNKWNGDESAAGDGSSWQMVCNLTKSQLNGVKAGGILAGEPRRDPNAWNTYVRWIEQGHQTCAVRARKRGYVLEWRIALTRASRCNPASITLRRWATNPWASTSRWAISTKKKRARGTSATSTTRTGGPD
jgi:hypothetical protein